MSTAPATWRFLLRVMLWLPACFLVWYLASSQWARPAGIASGVVARAVQPGIVKQVEVTGNTVAFVSGVKIRTPEGRQAVLAPEVNSSAYTFGSALFLSLMLASGARWQKTAAGLLLLLPFQGWGIAFDGLAQIVRASAHTVAGAGISASSFNWIAAGYQFGSLVFPTVIPVLVWGMFCRQYIADLRLPIPVAIAEAPHVPPSSPMHSATIQHEPHRT